MDQRDVPARDTSAVRDGEPLGERSPFDGQQEVDSLSPEDLGPHDGPLDLGRAETRDLLPLPDDLPTAGDGLEHDATRRDQVPLDAASPGDGALNEIDCSSPDWIEIVNPSEAPLDLGGWVVTDDPDDPDGSYALPAGSRLGPWERLVVERDELGSLGFSFGIRCDSDTLYLIRPDGTLADRVTPPAIPEEATWGRLPDGTGEWGLNRPTPGSGNEAWVAEELPGACPDVYASEILPVFLVEIAPEEWKALEDEYLHWIERLNQGLELKPYHPLLSFRFNDEVITTAMIRLKGNPCCSWGSPKMQFVISFNEIEGDGRFHGLRKIELDAPAYDPTLLRDRLSLSVARDRGIPASCANNAMLYVNGAYYGLYTNLEHTDKEFLRRNFGDQAGGNLYQFDYTYMVWENKVGPDDEMDDLLALYAVTDYASLRALMNMEAAVAEWALEVMVNDLDGYFAGSINFLLYHHPEGPFLIIPNDMDLSFNPNLDPFMPGNWSGLTPHSSMTLTDPEGWSLYLQALQSQQEAFDGEALTFRLDGWAAQVAPAVMADPNIPWDMHIAELDIIRQQLATRRQTISDGLVCASAQPSLVDTDGDGWWACYDCDDGNPGVHPWALDLCNGLDDDCDGLVDAGMSCTDCAPLHVGISHFALCPWQRNWADAQSRCGSHGNTLALPETPEEQEALAVALSAINIDNWWIGATDQGSEGVWLTSQGEHMGAPFWGPDRPNGGEGQNCAVLDAGLGYLWNDKDCAEPHGFICRLPPDPIAITQPLAGETWTQDSLHYIVLRASPGAFPEPPRVTVELSLDEGVWEPLATWPDGIEAVDILLPPGSPGKVLWKVGEAAVARFRILEASTGGILTQSLPVSIAPSQEDSGYVWENVTMDGGFAPRDGAGALSHARRMWLLGGWNPEDPVSFPDTTNSEVWSTTDGGAWRLVNPAAPWEGRHTAGYVEHREALWIVGGDANRGHYQPDVWFSADGLEWIQATAMAPWGQRVLHYTVTLMDRIFVMGGQTLPQFAPEVSETLFYDDVWSSEDGSTWTLVTEHAGWPARGLLCGRAVKDDRIWLLGGGTYDTPEVPTRKFMSDVWSSPDGASWSCHVEHAPWAPRQYHGIAVWDEKLWVLGGYDEASVNRNDVWYSSDGLNWYEVPDTPWSGRHGASLFVSSQALFIAAGSNMEPDVWRLTDADPD